MWFGLFLVGIGILFLLKNLGIIYGDIWHWAWPILIICIGIGIMIKPGCFSKNRNTSSDKSD